MLLSSSDPTCWAMDVLSSRQQRLISEEAGLWFELCLLFTSLQWS